jgi:AAA domain, putative AbiEii toxin, Type IV TA system/AAA domain
MVNPMRLIKLRLSQFRRFAQEQPLDLNEDVIALVGPNEAGKSSLLEAIEKLGARELPDPLRDVTRNGKGPATISGLFRLEAEDHKLISHMHGGPGVTHMWVDLTSGAPSPTWRLEPPPVRDIEPRHKAASILSKLEGDPLLAAEAPEADEPHWDRALFHEVQQYLTEDGETLPSDAIDAIELVGNRLRDLTPGNASGSRQSEETTAAEEATGVESKSERTRRFAREAAATALLDLAKTEREEHPARQVANALWARLPVVAVFRPEDRELDSEYEFEEVASDPPAALRNLCSVAGLNLTDVQVALKAGRTGIVEKLFEDANAKLKESYSKAWSQSTVYPRFGPPHEGTMHIWIATEGDTSYSEPHERSDGLRWFIALHAFLMGLEGQLPILVVDEAETHLHYDAQADLIEALMHQSLTAKVIYSTHSVGCLPPDLGRGIRAVLPERDAERSQIQNSYWSIDLGGADRVGYTPLLFAMGARLLSLTVPRYAVITEGASDAVLLPTLMREATGLAALPYRIVPGLADVTRRRMGNVSGHAGVVACLADGDAEGRKILAQVEKAGVQKRFLFNLGELRGDDSTLEDLVRAEVFSNAVNTEFATWAIPAAPINAANVPVTGRWNWLKALSVEGNDNGIADRLSKIRVAQRMVDQATGDSASAAVVSLLDAGVRTPLVKLHKKIVKALGV